MGHRDDVLMDSQVSFDKICRKERMTYYENIRWKYCEQ